jgi:hypothetical protein
MATNQIGKPTQLLITKVTSGTLAIVETIADEASNWYGYPTKFQVDITVAVQTHSDATTNTPFYYGANDIQVGDWLLQPSGKSYRVSSIVSVAGDSNATIVLEDVDNYVLLNDASGAGNNYPDEEQAGACIELDNEGLPILANIAQLSAELPGNGYWIDDIVGRFEATSTAGILEVGVGTGIDLNKNSVVTEADGDSTGIAITFTPFHDSIVTVKVNGVEINLGDGVKTEAAYFSGDEGSTARLTADITTGDLLYWNGSIAGYELDATDDIDISYQKSSLD